MNPSQHLECDTPDCIHWEDGECVKEASITIQKHHCADYKERIVLPTATVTIEVSGGLVQNVYASPDLPEIRIELIDMDDLEDESGQALEHGRRLLEETAQGHNHIF